LADDPRKAVPVAFRQAREGRSKRKASARLSAEPDRLDGFQNFTGDTINSAKAANGMIGRTMDFDLNGDNAVNFPGDTLLSARMASHVEGICP
jgi:hypothetical protein